MRALADPGAYAPAVRPAEQHHEHQHGVVDQLDAFPRQRGARDDQGHVTNAVLIDPLLGIVKCDIGADCGATGNVEAESERSRPVERQGGLTSKRW
jgi:hypothetical protein